MRKTIIGVATAGALVLVGVGAMAASDTPAAAVPESAIDAALAAVPGEFLEAEPEDDGREGFEVEIRTADGTEIEVHVDLDGNVVGMEQDLDTTSDDSSEDSDLSRKI